jgi:hypothetical protein
MHLDGDEAATIRYQDALAGIDRRFDEVMRRKG